MSGAAASFSGVCCRLRGLLFGGFLLGIVARLDVGCGLYLALEIVCSPLEFTEHLAQGLCNIGQFLRPDDDQGNGKEKEYVREAEFKHGIDL